jgi:hypothetical protein
VPWHEGPPPKDGGQYVVNSPAYDGPVVVQWLHYDGQSAFRDWDLDTHTEITRWHDLDKKETP